MIKILRILNRLNLGGPTFNAAYLSGYLGSEFETMLLAGEKDESEASSEFIVKNLGLEPHRIPEMRREINLQKDRIAYKKIRAIIRQFRPDIVHTHAAKAGALGRLAASKEKVPVILHTFHGHVFHSYFNPVKTRFFIEAERYLARRSTRIIAISEIQKKELGEIYRICAPEKIEVVPLGFDLDKFQDETERKKKQFRLEFGVKNDEITIGIIGRLVPIKNHRLFLEGIKHVAENSGKKIRAFIVGDGESRTKIEAFARALSIPFSTEKDKVHQQLLAFTSWRQDIDTVNAGLDIVVLTSLNEGTPVSLIEAQAADKPIVATDVGGVRDVVLENETALLCPSNDAKAFGTALLRLVEDDGLRERLGQSGAEHAKKQFGYQRLVADMREVYFRLLTQ